MSKNGFSRLLALQLQDFIDWVSKSLANSQIWLLIKIWSLGVAILNSGNYCSWNQVLQSGKYGFCTITILAGTAFACLSLCISEIISGLPFSGGAFGMVRCSLGFFPGYIIGCSEVCYYLLTFSQCVYPLTLLIASGYTLSVWAQACLCLALHIVISALLIQRNSLVMFWIITTGLALTSLLITCLYCFGSIGTSLSSNINWDVSSASNDALTTIRSFHTVTWFYTGIECLVFASNMVPAPRKLIAKGFFASLCTTIASNIFVVCITLYVYEDVEQLALETFPLNRGFIRVFKCTDVQAILLSVPSFLGSCYGCAFGYSKLLSSLAESGLFPSFLATCTNVGSPYKSILFGALVSYWICLVMQFSPTASLVLVNFCFLSSYISNCGYCVSYVLLKFHYSGSIDFTFKSPLGIGGAFYGICVFVLGMISVVVSDRGESLCLLVVYWTCATFYYFGIAHRRQKFSADEQKSIFLSRGLALVSSLKGKVRQRRRRRFSSRIYIAPTVPVAHEKQNEVNLKERLQNPRYQKLKAIHEMLLDPTDAENLREKAAATYCTENVDFCLGVIAYRKHIEGVLKQGSMYENWEGIHCSFSHIINTYIVEGSSQEVNLSSQQKKCILKYQNSQELSTLHPMKMATVFDDALAEIEHLLAENLHVSGVK